MSNSSQPSATKRKRSSDRPDSNHAESSSPHIDTKSDLRAAVQYAVIQICSTAAEEEEDCAEQHSRTRMSPRAIAALSELTFQFTTTCLSADLEAFSNHAGRRTINMSDVLLVVRKHPDLLAKLQDFCDRQQEKNDFTRGKKRPPVDRFDPQKARTAAKEPSLSDDTSSIDDLMMNDSPKIRKDPVPQKIIAHRKRDSLEDSDSSTDAEIKTLESRKGATAHRLKNQSRHAAVTSKNDDSLLCDSSSNNDEANYTEPKFKKLKLPEKRFRLGQRNSPVDSSSSSDNDDELETSRKQCLTSKSRVEQILDDMSDSV